MVKHRWSKEDYTVALFLQKYGVSKLPWPENEIAVLIGVTESSIECAKSNFSYLIKGKGLPHYSKLQKEIYIEYKKLSEDKLRVLIIDYLRSLC